jgi:hypothetical protein
MMNRTASITLLLAGFLAAASARADYLAPDPGTQISIQLNSRNVIVVRPVGGVWSHGLCPDVTAAVLSRSHFTRPSHGLTESNLIYDTVWELLVQAAMNGRSVNLQVSDTVCHGNGYPLIESLRIFP